jgi:hypothetical protein
MFRKTKVALWRERSPALNPANRRIRTVCTVVWEERSREAPPYPDCGWGMGFPTTHQHPCALTRPMASATTRRNATSSIAPGHRPPLGPERECPGKAGNSQLRSRRRNRHRAVGGRLFGVNDQLGNALAVLTGELFEQ